MSTRSGWGRTLCPPVPQSARRGLLGGYLVLPGPVKKRPWCILKAPGSLFPSQTGPATCRAGRGVGGWEKRKPKGSPPKPKWPRQHQSDSVSDSVSDWDSEVRVKCTYYRVEGYCGIANPSHILHPFVCLRPPTRPTAGRRPAERKYFQMVGDTQVDAVRVGAHAVPSRPTCHHPKRSGPPARDRGKLNL